MKGFSPFLFSLVQYVAAHYVTALHFNFLAREHRSDIKPIFWLHVPKSGTSFETAVMHLACGDCVTLGGHVEPGKRDKKLKHKDEHHWDGATQEWNRRCGDNTFMRFESNHAPMWRIGNIDEDLGHVVTMVRDPTKRIVSGWNHNKHDCPAPDFDSYAECTNACATQMINGYWCGPDFRVHSPAVTRDPQTAIARMKQFGFVGLTDEYDFSVCLLHAMYGGDCSPYEFVNVRKGSYSVLEASVEERLASNHSGADATLYQAAKKIFWKNMARFKVSRSTCLNMYCSKVPHVFTPVDIPNARTGRTSDEQYEFDWPGRLIFDD